MSCCTMSAPRAACSHRAAPAHPRSRDSGEVPRSWRAPAACPCGGAEPGCRRLREEDHLHVEQHPSVDLPRHQAHTAMSIPSTQFSQRTVVVISLPKSAETRTIRTSEEMGASSSPSAASSQAATRRERAGHRCELTPGHPQGCSRVLEDPGQRPERRWWQKGRTRSGDRQSARWCGVRGCGDPEPTSVSLLATDTRLVRIPTPTQRLANFARSRMLRAMAARPSAIRRSRAPSPCADASQAVRQWRR